MSDPAPVTMTPFWKNQAAQLVRESLSDAMKAKRADYDTNIEEIGAFLDGNHEDVTDDALQKHYKTLYDNANNSIRYEYMPLIPFLVDKLACWLVREPRVWLSDELGKPIRRDDKNALNLRSLIRDTNLNEYRWQGERYQAAFRTAGWQVAWREGEVCFDLYRPNQYEVYESEIDPRRLDWARAIVIPNYVPNWAPSSDTDDYSERAGSKTVWIRSPDPVLWGAFQIGHDELPMADMPGVFPTGFNGYKRHPFIHWTELPPTDGVFVDCDDTLLRAQKNVNLLFTDIGETISFDSFGIKVVRGINVKDLEMPTGQRAWHKLDEPEASIEVVGPKARIFETLQYLNHWLRYQSVFRNLPPELFDLDKPSNTSGVTMAIGRLDLKDARANRRDLMRANYRRLLELAIVVNNYHVSSRQIDPSLRVNVMFPGEEYRDPTTRQAEAQARDFEYKSGARSPVDDYLRETMEIDPMTATDEEVIEAKTAVRRNAGEWAGLNQIGPPQRQGSGGKKPDDSQDDDKRQGGGLQKPGAE